MKKICMIVPNLCPLPSVRGGAIETLVTNLIIENEKEKKIDLTVISIYDEGAYIESKKYQNTKFIYIKTNLKYCFTSLVYKTRIALFKEELNTYNHIVLSKIKNKDFDYIFVEGGKYECFDEYLKYFKKEQMILHIHHELESSKKIDSIFSNAIAISNFIAENFKKSSNMNHDNIKLLINGIDLSKFQKTLSTQEKSNLREKLGLKKEDFVVIYCGRLIKEKGVLELVKAIKLIDKKDLKLLIVGSLGFGKNQTSEYIENLNNEIESVKENVVSIGYIDNNELYKYYNIANVQAIPSTCQEAGGLVSIEGAATGLPIIITKTGGVADYVSEESAILVENDENLIYSLKTAILELYENREKCEKLSINARNYAKNYDKSNYYNNFLNIINDLDKEKYGKK